MGNGKPSKEKNDSNTGVGSATEQLDVQYMVRSWRAGESSESIISSGLILTGPVVAGPIPCSVLEAFPAPAITDRNTFSRVRSAHDEDVQRNSVVFEAMWSLTKDSESRLYYIPKDIQTLIAKWIDRRVKPFCRYVEGTNVYATIGPLVHSPQHMYTNQVVLDYVMDCDPRDVVQKTERYSNPLVGVTHCDTQQLSMVQLDMLGEHPEIKVRTFDNRDHWGEHLTNLGGIIENRTGDVDFNEALDCYREEAQLQKYEYNEFFRLQKTSHFMSARYESMMRKYLPIDQTKILWCMARDGLGTGSNFAILQVALDNRSYRVLTVDRPSYKIINQFDVTTVAAHNNRDSHPQSMYELCIDRDGHILVAEYHVYSNRTTHEASRQKIKIVVRRHF